MLDFELRQILEQARVVAVVGLSDDPNRESYHVAEYLSDHGYQIIPVNPTIKEALGERSYASLLDVNVPVDVIDIFRRAEAVPAIVDDAIAVGAKVVWMQLGIVNEQAAARARSAGLKVVMNRCMMLEHESLLGR
jgi:uncharacterized protein